MTAPVRIASPSGLVADVNANGSLRRLEHRDVVLNLFPASEIEGGPANVYVRRLGPSPAWTSLLGPESPLAFELDETGLRAAGVWQDVRITLALRLAASAPAWFWHVALASAAGDDRTLELVYAQDVALAPYGAIRMNEYYVSQYLDHTPLRHPTHGAVVAVRQNLAMGGRHPWVAIGSLSTAASFATDALQVHGLATRASETPAGLAGAGLPGARRQHEHAMVGIQDAPIHLPPGGTAARGFFGWFEPDHPDATTDADLRAVDRALGLPEASAPAPTGSSRATPAARTLFSSAPVLRCRDLDDVEIAARWGIALRHVERDGDRMLSFFTGDEHVATRAKELRVLRPHGHLVRTGDALVPDEAALTTTVWMAGVFNSLLTQGHVGINRMLSATRSYLGLQRAHGQRVFVELDRRWHRLDVPSAWAVTPTSAHWVYAHAAGVVEVWVAAATGAHAIDCSIAVTAGAPARVLVASHSALGGDDGADPVPVRMTRDARGIVLHAVPDTDVGRRFPTGAFRIDPLPGTGVEEVAGDAPLFADGRSRDQPYVTIVTAPTSRAGFRITGELVPATALPAGPSIPPATIEAPATSGLARDVARVHDILPWYVHDALIHYLAPRGLEQFSGGGWGTRDVCQGPVELLLALDATAPVRDVLLRVFANQNPDGDWPQWFMFFDRERDIRPSDSHGDIAIWPLLALARYVIAAGDATILDAVVPFFHADPPRAERTSVWRHVERALDLLRRRVVLGTRLVAFGHGDWDDSLQPVDPAMREELCSTWTVTLHHQTLATLAAALRAVGHDADAAPLERDADAVREDFVRWLLPDATLPGFAHFRPGGGVDYLLHPRDRATGIRYRLLPMIHAIIADLLTPAEAAAHVAIVRTHLLGADGARLCDPPPAYRGGPERFFQRAESSSFFGREIGLMYTHAHLRWAEALAHLGETDAFFEALRRVSPIALDTVVPAASPRQASCYYSSSDAAVADRYEANARYDDVRAGRFPFDGGWRVYSSGAGIAVRLVHECFLGLRRGRALLGVDPVVPKALDGLVATITLDGRPVRVAYRIAAKGHGPTAVRLNGGALPTTRVANPYRAGGVTIPMTAVREGLRPERNELAIDLG